MEKRCFQNLAAAAVTLQIPPGRFHRVTSTRAVNRHRGGESNSASCRVASHHLDVDSFSRTAHEEFYSFITAPSDLT